MADLYDDDDDDYALTRLSLSSKVSFLIPTAIASDRRIVTLPPPVWVSVSGRCCWIVSVMERLGYLVAGCDMAFVLGEGVFEKVSQSRVSAGCEEVFWNLQYVVDAECHVRDMGF
jgi:hypothetical protein